MRGTLTSELHDVPDAVDDFLEEAERRGWGDGLPLVPPTERRVQDMLDFASGAPHDVIAVAEPSRADVTNEKVAINAVMAGCRPAYFPVVAAAVRAVCAPAFNLYALNTTTCSATPALLVNGPARIELGVEHGYSCLGHNGRANATIGRALRLVLRNVAGALPATVSKSTFGQPGRLSLCFGEWEEKSPWDPFHVRRGFAREESVATVHCATGTQDIADTFAEDGEELLWVIAHSIDWVGNNKVLVPQDEGEMMILLCPDFAAKIDASGMTLADAQQFLRRQTLTPIERWHRRHWPKLEAKGFVEDGKVPLCARPEQFLLVVAGGESGHHALSFCTFGHTSAVSVVFSLEPDGAEAESCPIPGVSS